MAARRSRMDKHHPALAAAIKLWRHGYPVPLDIIGQLLADGFDVEALERRYSTQ